MIRAILWRCFGRTMTLKVSVVLCTYNGEAYLGEQLDSLLAQTRLPDEVVLGDDGSADSTIAMLESFMVRAQSKGVSTRLIRQSVNQGFVENFSRTLRLASGDLLFLCDQDDLWSSEKLALMEQRFVDDPDLLLLSTDARLVDAQGADLGLSLFNALELRALELRQLHEGKGFDVLLCRSLATGATVGMRRALIDDALPVGDGWIHDEWLAIVASSLGKVDVLEQQLIDYRQHGRNQVGMRKRGLRDKWRDLIRSRRAQFEAEVSRLFALEMHLRGLGAAASADKVSQRAAHFRVRLSLGQRPRALRLPQILREAGAGNYRRYGTGVRSFLRDLLRHD